MGRNKKDPKPLNEPDFAALVKAARDFLSRAEAQARAATRKMLQITDAEGAPIKVIFEMVGDEDEPRGLLRALDSAGQTLAQEEVEPNFPFQRPRLEAWARLADDLDRDRLALMTTRVPLTDVIETARAIVDGKVRGRVVVEVG
jgi:hypothetical protein